MKQFAEPKDFDELLEYMLQVMEAYDAGEISAAEADMHTKKVGKLTTQAIHNHRIAVPDSPQ